MNFPKSNKYDKSFVMENMMGPNCMKMLEELTTDVKLEKGMRVMDLGCGTGLTSVFLAKEFGVQVFATDLWITATDNYKRFKELNLENQITPIHADALEMPYAEEYFDAIVSVDSYHYFGNDESFMDSKLAPLVKKGGLIAIAVPGLKQELTGELPKEMALSWTKEDIQTMHSCDWWKELLAKSKTITVESITEMKGFDEPWDDWINSTNDFQKFIDLDKPAIEAGAGKYMNFVSIIARKK